MRSASPVSTHENLLAAEPVVKYGIGSAKKLQQTVDSLAPLAEISHDLVKQTDLLYKLATRLIETCEKECDAKSSNTWNPRDVTRARKAADETRQQAAEQLKQVRYFWRQAHWLTERFPKAKLRDVEGLVKLVDRAEIKTNDWSLTPGRYVGVAPEEEDENFDFEEALREIHVETGRPQRRIGEIGRNDQEKLRGVRDIRRPAEKPLSSPDPTAPERRHSLLT